MSFLQIKRDKNNISFITLKREEVHNAFNDELIAQLTEAFKKESLEARMIVLTGAGKSFCAGADLNWMKSMVDFDHQTNKEDSIKLANLFSVINQCSVPVIGKINGHALGGGVGLVSVCDYVHTHEKAKFGFTEVKLGLVPAVISPYCIAKIGESNARAWFLSGDLFSADEAKKMQLVHSVSSLENFEEDFSKILDKFLQAAPKAQVAAKEMIDTVLKKEVDLTDYTTDLIAKIRVSSEGQEGMKALLNKTKASWINEN